MAMIFIKKLTSDTRVLYFCAIILLFVFIIVSAWVIFNIDGNNNNNNLNNDPSSINKFKNDYSRLDKIKPGQSTIDQTIKINGEPVSSLSEGDETHLRFSTPNSGLSNDAVFKNGILQYAIEYVFSDYRGTYTDFVEKHGAPSLILYSNAHVGLEWALFLNEGVGVEHTNNEILRIIYFIPQDKKTFINNFLGVLDVSETIPTPVEELDIMP